MSSIGPAVSEEKMFENVDGRRTDDGRRSHWYTISSPEQITFLGQKTSAKKVNDHLSLLMEILEHTTHEV